MKKLYLLPLLFSLVLTSCKDDDSPVPGPDIHVATTSFKFRFDPQPEETQAYELILSQKDGVVLLDTVIAAGAEHNLKVKSADTKFDVTTIYTNPTDKKYIIRTYVQVNPNNWHIDEGISPIVWGQRALATIYYTNVPSWSETHFAALQTGSYGSSQTFGELTVEYQRLLPADLAYLLVPGIEKYIFTEINSAETHVDFSDATIAEGQKYNWPTGVSNFVSILLGYTKAGDYSKPMILYLQNRKREDTYDVQYPTTVIEEFGLTLKYTDAEGYGHSYIYSGSTIPAVMPFVAKSDFVVTKAAANDFQIKFTEDKPTTYRMRWESRDLNASWHVFSSPEETAFKSGDFLENLNTLSLKGKNVSSFEIKRLTSYKAEGYSHQTMHDYNNTPEAFLRKDLRVYREIEKRF